MATPTNVALDVFAIIGVIVLLMFVLVAYQAWRSRRRPRP